MRIQTATAVIVKYNLGIHWHAIISGLPGGDRWRKYMKFNDACKYALRYVYARNITSR